VPGETVAVCSPSADLSVVDAGGVPEARTRSGSGSTSVASGGLGLAIGGLAGAGAGTDACFPMRIGTTTIALHVAGMARSLVT